MLSKKGTVFHTKSIREKRLKAIIIKENLVGFNTSPINSRPESEFHPDPNIQEQINDNLSSLLWVNDKKHKKNYTKQDWKNIPADTRIEAARNGCIKHGFKYNDKRHLPMLNKRMKLAPIQRLVGPISQLRVLD